MQLTQSLDALSLSKSAKWGNTGAGTVPALVGGFFFGWRRKRFAKGLFVFGLLSPVALIPMIGCGRLPAQPRPHGLKCSERPLAGFARRMKHLGCHSMMHRETLLDFAWKAACDTLSHLIARYRPFPAAPRLRQQSNRGKILRHQRLQDVHRGLWQRSSAVDDPRQ